MRADPLSPNLLDRITVDPARCGAHPCIRGYRIRVIDVFDLMGAGLSVESLIGDLTLEEISARARRLRGSEP